MAKERKNPASPGQSAEQAGPASNRGADGGQAAAPGSVLGEVRQEVKAQVLHTTGYLHLDYFTILWLFVGGCVFGLAVETVFHAIVYGGLESRAGLVWGPFSPIYGAGSVILTLTLNRFYHSHNLVIFLIAMTVGSAIEYATSWGMEYFWGAVAWDYTGTFGSINGRTNFAFGMMWGMLGLFWVRFAIPFVKRVFSHIDAKSLAARVLTVAMSAFLAVDIMVTMLALDRQGQRASGIPATTAEQQLFDEWFPDSFMQARFQNMSVYGK